MINWYRVGVFRIYFFVAAAVVNEDRQIQMMPLLTASTS